MAKLLKLRRGTTSQHNTFTGAEGEVTIDTTKDTAVVHDGAQAGGRPLAREDMSNVSSSSIAGRLGADSIATTKIAGGALPTDVTVTNANVVSNAGISGTKISPNFGGQNIQTTGQVQIAGSEPTILLNDENNENDFKISNTNGTFKIRDIDNPTDRYKINSSGTIHQFLGSADFNSTVNVSGNITTGGTVDGRDVASDGSKLDGIESGATADQSASEILTAIKTVDGSGSGLDADTLQGATPSVNAGNNTIVKRHPSGYIFANYFNTTPNDVTSGITKVCVETNNDGYIRHGTAGGVRSFLNVEDGATADQSASEILTAIKTVDGAGSGLDADTLDGVNSTSFLRSDAADSASQDITFNGGGGAVTIGGNSDIRLNAGNWTGEASAKIQHHSNHLYVQYPDAGTFRVRDSAGNDNFTVDSSGNATAVGNVTAYSDARLKTDISTINDALGIVGKLRGVSYKWLRDGTEGIGVIAQEVEAVIPSVVVTNEVPGLDGMEEVKSVDYGKIVGVLINAINELKAEIDELKGGK